ncbi:unnamed protein product [Meganyctiphanes norvegica]|uniref:G-protein coupled receptors family 1 profile domain-containing protein n=1 Tax=Meganyctiphanes norvegica TaxID=48144 RepID=A0AAV2QNU4_MEGNR
MTLSIATNVLMNESEPSDSNWSAASSSSNVTFPYMPDDVAMVLHVSYHVVFPILLTLVIITNGLCLAALTRPKLQVFHITQYMKFMTGADLVGGLTWIPPIILITTCPFTNFSAAYLYNCLGWPTVTLIRKISLYLLIWMTYDRFLAIWFPSHFKIKVNNSRIVYVKCAFSFTLAFLYFLVRVISCKVECVNVNDNISFDTCPSYERISIEWYNDIRFYFLEIITIPVDILLILLSVGLVTGLFLKMGTSGSKNSRKSRQFYQTVALLVINISHVLCNLPFRIMYKFFHAKEDKHCHSTVQMELFIAVGNCLPLVWSGLNIAVFFLLNKDYKEEMKECLSSIPVLGKIFCSSNQNYEETEIEEKE